MERLTSYHWPGNVRELQNVLKRYLVTGNWKEIIDEFSSPKEPSYTSIPAKPALHATPTFNQLFDLQGEDSPELSSFSLKKITKKVLDSVEKEVISHVLDQTLWNRSKAAKILKISYKTLLYKISDLNIKPPLNSKFKNSEID
jgi:DNA-binding NtrC family response regulator